ncbi:MAG: GC-type dockerin domain-anchored protein [Planctomycetota bacterium]|nr:GC-type dockerin domain-anchored protein [Planctomycetota bacterium]
MKASRVASSAGLAASVVAQVVVGLAFASAASAQMAPVASRSVPIGIASGDVQVLAAERNVVPANQRAISDVSEQELTADTIIWADVVDVPDAAWLRLYFKDVNLSGDAATQSGAYLRITSLLDGHTQKLNADALRQWNNSSAYFNGDRVLVELISAAANAPARVTIDRADVGVAPVMQGGYGPRSICGSTDDRTLSSDPKNARHMPVGCTSWLINDTNQQFLLAGHCDPTSGNVFQFNVPLSTSTGVTVNPSPDDQYVVDMTSKQSQNITIGQDWCYIGVFTNANHGLTPAQKMGGGTYILASTPPAVASQTIRITGFGTTSSPVSNTWNQVQKTHTGPYRTFSGTTLTYSVDTTGGNSGSPIEDLSTGRAIGIHTNAGCTTTAGSANSGTGINNAALQSALANPLGVCATGRSSLSLGRLYAGTDAANNFGTVNATTGAFGKFSQFLGTLQGMAFDRDNQWIYAVDNSRRLFTINPTTGAAVLKGTITGTTLTLNGLGYDPVAKKLYSIAQSNGQLFTINTSTLVATAVGTAAGGIIGALEFNPADNTLYGINDPSSQLASSRLVRINTTTGAITSVSSAILAGVRDCNGLAWDQTDGKLYTIDNTTRNLIRIDPATGAGTAVAACNGLFGSGSGMTAVQSRPPCPADFNNDGFLDFTDFDGFVAAFEAGSGSGDFNADGFIDFTDFDAFVAAFEAGC